VPRNDAERVTLEVARLLLAMSPSDRNRVRSELTRRGIWQARGSRRKREQDFVDLVLSGGLNAEG
jgi:hypothetical protein